MYQVLFCTTDSSNVILEQIRNNVAPIEQIRVGPGLNKGYTWKPSGGIQQSETRNYVLPKRTNETRVRNNPKVTYTFYLTTFIIFW